MLDDDPLVALRETRSRFIAAFPAQCEAVEQLAVDAAGDRGRPERAAAWHQVHRVTRLAGTIGLPGLSTRAAALESLLLTRGPYDPQLARDLARAMADAFASDLATPPDWAFDAPRPARSSSVLVVEGDPDQRSIVTACLRGAGHDVQELASGERVAEHARTLRPSVILLDDELPGIDVCTVCRLLKADPELAGIAVMILTTRPSLDHQLIGLTLGADDLLRKPVDTGDLLVRVRRLSGRVPAADPPEPADALTYPLFVSAARILLSVGPAAVALVRVPRGAAGAGAVKAFRQEVRRRDILGRYNDTHLVLLLPGMTATAARDRLRDVIRSLQEAGHEGVTAGIAGAAGGASTVEALFTEADEALAEARAHGEIAATRGTRPTSGVAASVRHLVLADDDPAAAQIVDAYMRAEGFSTTLALDGPQALDAVTRERPDVLVLDLMQPGMTGFDVLLGVRALAENAKPRVIVLSGPGREEDVTHAFDLGADDYMLKPVSPRELHARIVGLLR